MLIFDGHLDLAMNAVEWNRDLTRSLEEVRQREAGMSDKVDRGQGVITLPEMRRGKIGLCIATQIGRYVDESNPWPGWHSPEIAWAITKVFFLPILCETKVMMGMTKKVVQRALMVPNQAGHDPATPASPLNR